MMNKQCHNSASFAFDAFPMEHYQPKQLFISSSQDLKQLPSFATTSSLEISSMNVWTTCHPPSLINHWILFQKKRDTFGPYFNEPVNCLPLNITHPTFGDSFNQAVDLLPSGIVHPYFGHSFQRSVDCLPLNLMDLSFGYFLINQ